MKTISYYKAELKDKNEKKKLSNAIIVPRIKLMQNGSCDGPRLFQNRFKFYGVGSQVLMHK